MSELKFLIVEDSKMDQTFYKRSLSKDAKFSYQTLFADNGKEARELFKEKELHFLLLDFMLPDANGLDLLEEFRKLHPNTPVVMSTGKGDEEVIVEAMKKGADDYLVKGSYSPEKLLETVHHAIDKRKYLHQFELAQMNLEKTNSELNQSILQMNDFVSVVSHDLKAPLATSITILESILEGDFGEINPKQEKFLLMIREQIQNSNQLIYGLLDLSKFEDKNLKKKNIPVNLLLEEAIDTFYFDHNSKNIQFGEFENWKFRVFGEKQLLSQMLKNLIGNAIKYAPKKGSIQFSFQDGDENFSELSIYNQGPVVPDQEIDHIFRRFQQGEKPKEGHGIGLFFCKKIMDLHRGEIFAEKGRKEGFNIIVKIPKE
jgi:signal transduction histidine kinase